MKKLMIAAAAVAMIGAAEAGIALTNCHKTVTQDCTLVFKITASGKTVEYVDTDALSYKKVSALKVKKGALILWGTAVGGDCCYDQYSLYLNAKVGKTDHKLAWLGLDLDKWSVFGKNVDAALTTDKSKKYKLDSDLGFAFGDEDSSTDIDAFEELTGVTLAATSFGTATYKYSASTTKQQGKGACAICVVNPDAEQVVPGNYKGWFAGFFEADGTDGMCMTCACNDVDMFGGTWTAKFDKNTKNWKKAAAYVFGSSVAAAMAAEEIE